MRRLAIVISQMKNIGIFKVYIAVAVLSPSLMAAELSIPFVVEHACPFEGCTFGMWEVLRDTSVYKETSIESDVVNKLALGTKANIETGVLYVVAGKAKVTGKPYKTASNVKPNEFVYILDYLGEGYSRIYQAGIFYETKVARTKERCTKQPNWRYCWVDILEEPKIEWWVKVKGMGWVLMESKPLKPIDALSLVLPYDKSFIYAPTGLDAQKLRAHNSVVMCLT